MVAFKYRVSKAGTKTLIGNGYEVKTRWGAVWVICPDGSKEFYLEESEEAAWDVAVFLVTKP